MGSIPTGVIMNITKQQAILFLHNLNECEDNNCATLPRKGPFRMSIEECFQIEREFLLAVNRFWPDVIEEYKWLHSIQNLKKEGLM